jgi:hypothetical protein
MAVSAGLSALHQTSLAEVIRKSSLFLELVAGQTLTVLGNFSRGFHFTLPLM